MIKSLNVAMIGGGFMGKAHAMAYAAMPMFFWPAPAIPHRKVVVDVNDVLAEEARQRFGFEEASSNWKDTIARDDIDVVDFQAILKCPIWVKHKHLLTNLHILVGNDG